MKWNLSKSLSGALVVLLLGAQIAFAAPGLLNYQGRLADATTGDPITSTVNVTFTFWDADVDGNQLGSSFSDTDAVTPDSDGIYATLIGDDPANLVPASIFENDSVWLNVNVGGEDLVPRKRITSVGFAVQAASADTAATADYSTEAGSVTKIIRDFVVATGESVTAGDVVAMINEKVKPFNAVEPSPVYEFNAGATTYVTAAKLTDSRFVVAYTDNSNSSYGTAFIGEISGTEISWGTPNVFNAGTTGYNSIGVLAEDKIVIAYQDGSAGGIGNFIVGTISGTTFSWGSEDTFNATMEDTNNVAVLTSSTIVLAYRELNPSTVGRACVGSVSGTSVSWGAEYAIRGDRTDDIKAVPLDTSRFMTIYFSTTTGQGHGRIGTVSGGSISWGTESTLESSTINDTALVFIDTDKVVAAYRDTTASSYGASKVGTVSGTTISWGAKSYFNLTTSSQISLASWSPTQIAAAYRFEGTAGSCIAGTVSGTTITWDSNQDFNSGDLYHITALPMVMDGWLLLTYRDVASGNHGFLRLFIPGGESADEMLGIADASAGSDETVPVILQGVSDHHSGLSVFSTYYGGGNGGLTAADNGATVGRAVSDTDLLLTIH
ncbi:hypothetical protein KQI84_10795 [bacterium]|nr:hypothetical protein [bacterium]